MGKQTQCRFCPNLTTNANAKCIYWAHAKSESTSRRRRASKILTPICTQSESESDESDAYYSSDEIATIEYQTRSKRKSVNTNTEQIKSPHIVKSSLNRKRKRSQIEKENEAI